MHAIWLVLTYDLLEDRCIDDVIIKTFFLYILILYYIKQIDSKLPCICSVIDHRGCQNNYGKNISETFGCASCATFLFLPHFDVICGLLPNRCTETWNLFVEHILHTVLYTFPKVLTRRICLTILSYPYLLTLSFILVTLMFYLGVINKLDASLSLRSKGWRKFRRKFSIFLLW